MNVRLDIARWINNGTHILSNISYLKMEKLKYNNTSLLYFLLSGVQTVLLQPQSHVRVKQNAKIEAGVVVFIRCLVVM